MNSLYIIFPFILMKEDMLFYLLLPIILLVKATMVASLLPLLNLIDISAEITNSSSEPSKFEFLFLMFVLYYILVAVIAKYSGEASAAKIRNLSMTEGELMQSSGYGMETKRKVK